MFESLYRSILDVITMLLCMFIGNGLNVYKSVNLFELTSTHVVPVIHRVVPMVKNTFNTGKHMVMSRVGPLMASKNKKREE